MPRGRRYTARPPFPLLLHGEELDLKPSQANPEEKALGVELRPAAHPDLSNEKQDQNHGGQDIQGPHIPSAGGSGSVGGGTVPLSSRAVRGVDSSYTMGLLLERGLTMEQAPHRRGGAG